MRKAAVSPSDHSIGYRTSRALSDDNAWSYANNKCGTVWTICGTLFFILSVASVFLISSDSVQNAAQLAFLMLQIFAVIITALIIEKHLKSMNENK